MADRKKMSSVVSSGVKSLDPEAIVQGTLYDEASNRLVVTLVKGRRRVQVVLPGRWFDNGYSDRLDRALKDGINRLKQAPIG
jgi:hypothetical protein